MWGWTTSKLSEVTSKIGSGATPKGGKKSYKQEGISLIRSMNVHDGEFKEKDLAFIDDDQAGKLSNVVVESGDVLLNITGASIARSCIAPENHLPARVNQHVSILRPIRDLICSKFLNYLLISYEYKKNLLVSGDKAGATREALTKNQLQEFEICYPPIPEQKRIVAILDQAFADIDRARALTEQNLKNSRELFDSTLQQVFSQRGEGWEATKLGDIAKVSSGGTPKKSVKEYWEGEIPWYSSGELNNIYTCPSKSFITELGLNESNAKLFPKGSLLIGMYDTAALKMSILDRSAAFNQAIAGVEPNSEINLEFVLQWINTIKPMLLAQRRGVRQKNLNQSKIKSIPIDLPSLLVQNKVAARIEEARNLVDALVEIHTCKLASLEELKKSLLQKAFSGQLTDKDAA